MPKDIREFTRPQEVADAGERIYRERHKDTLEGQSPGQFAAIDVLSGEAYVAKFPEDALSEAQRRAPGGLFHLIRIGSANAFRTSRALDVGCDWVFR